MLQDIRKSSQGTTAKIIIGLIILAFAGFGVESILLGGGASGIAEVNGEEITEPELMAAINTQKRRLMSMMGESLDPAMLDDDRLRPVAMETLVARKLMMQTAESLGLKMSDRETSEVITSMEAFQVDGVFSSDQYRDALRNAGYTPGSFKRSIQDDLVLAQLSSGIAGSEFVTEAEFDTSVAILAEQRDLRYLTIARDQVLGEQVPEPSEEEIQAWYEANRSSFMTPETVDLDYLLLTVDDFRQPVSESAIQEAFDLSLDGFQYQARSKVSHILFTGTGDLSIEDALARAQSDLAAGTPFAEVAASLSDDAGSATVGGELGFTTGDTFPEEMEAAIASAEVGVVTDPVETDAGTHLILVTERVEGELPELNDELRAQFTEDIQVAEARAELLRAVETLRDLVFNAEDLSAPAQQLGLEVQAGNGISRSVTQGLFASESLRAAAFSEEVLVAGHNSEVVELADEQFVTLRVREHRQPEAKPLADVRETVVARIREEAAREAVIAEARTALARVRAGERIEDVAAQGGYPWQVELGIDRRSPALSAAVLDALFAMPAPSGDEVVADLALTETGDGVVVKLIRVVPGAADSLAAQERQQLSQGLVSQVGSLLNSEFQAGMRDRAEINIR